MKYKPDLAYIKDILCNHSVAVFDYEILDETDRAICIGGWFIYNGDIYKDIILWIPKNLFVRDNIPDWFFRKKLRQTYNIKI